MDNLVMQFFKNKGGDHDAMRQKRNEVTTELRKNQREEALLNRRNVRTVDSADHDEYKKLEAIRLQQLVVDAGSMNPEVQLRAVQSVGELFWAYQKTPVNFLISCGILRVLVSCLGKSETPTLQYEAARALVKISSGNHLQTQAVVDAGAVPLLLQLLSSKHQGVCAQAMRVLGRIIDDGPSLRDYVIDLGLVPPLLTFIKPETPVYLLLVVAYVIVSLCSNTEPSPLIKTIQDLLPALNVLIHHSYIKIPTVTLCAISRLVFGSNDRIQMVIDSGVVPRLIPLLSHNEEKIQTAALRLVSCIETGTREQTQIVLDCDALSHHPKENICMEALRFLSKITGGNQPQVQAVINAGLLPKIIINLNRVELQTKRSAAMVIRNLAIGGNREQVMTLIQEGVVPPFCALLGCEDIQVIRVVLKGLSSMLGKAAPQVGHIVNAIEDCGGYNSIQGLRNHENVRISGLAQSIVVLYFFVDDDDPAAVGG